LLFFAIFEVFSGDLGCYYSHPHTDDHHLWTSFEVLANGPFQSPVGLFQASFLSWLKPLVTPLLFSYRLHS